MSISGGGIRMTDTEDAGQEARAGLTSKQPSGVNLDAVMEQHDRAASASAGSADGVQWMPLLGGGLLAGYGLSRGSFGGLLVAAAGGGLVYYGMTGRMPSLTGGSVPDGERSVRVEEVVTINCPIDAVYD